MPALYTLGARAILGAHESGAPSGLCRSPASAGPQGGEGHLASLRRDGGHPLPRPPSAALPDRPRLRRLRRSRVLRARVELARRSPAYRETPGTDGLVHHAAFDSASARTLRDLFELVSGRPGTEVDVDGKRVPYARELWLPLFWIFVGAEAPSTYRRWRSPKTSRRSKSRSASSRSSGTSSSAGSRRSRPPTSRPAWRRSSAATRTRRSGTTPSASATRPWRRSTTRSASCGARSCVRARRGRPSGVHGLKADVLPPPPPPARAPEQRAARPAAGNEFRVQNPERDLDAVRALFDNFLVARQKTGERRPSSSRASRS